MKKKFLISSLLVTSTIAAVGISQFAKSSSTTITNIASSLNDVASTTSSGLTNLLTNTDFSKQVEIPKSYYQQNSFKNLSNDNGPILLFDNARSFGATDWYGNPSWYITLNSETSKQDGYYSSAWFSTSTTSAIDFSKAGTKVVDWAYNHKTDNLYVLTDTSYLIIVSSKDGTIVSTSEVNNGVNKIQIIDFNSSVYLWNSKQKNQSIYTVEPQTGKVISNSNISLSTTSFSSKYLIGLIPLDVNYSIAVTSDSDISSSTSSVTLTLTFVDDKFTTFSGANNQTVNLSNAKSSDIFIQGFKRSSDYVIFIGNKIYSVSLNKSSMGSSSFTNLINSSNSGSTKFTMPTDGKVNSVFIDSNNQIYFKTSNSKNITYISVSNTFTNIEIQVTSNKAFTSEDSAKAAQVFAVPISSKDDIVSQSYVGYTLSPNDFAGTGFTNGTLMSQKYTSSSYSPTFKISDVNSSSVPSSVNTNNISTGNTISGLTLENNSAILIANDYTGQLFVKVPYTIKGAWYGNGNNSIVSRGYMIGKFKYSDVATATSWTSQATFSTLFGSYEPSQIDVTALKKQSTSIINVPQSILSVANNKLDINFIITNRDNDKGTIKLSATIKYVNAYGSTVSYSMTQQQEYTVKKAATKYAFLFAGENDNNADKNKVNVTKKETSELINDAKTAVSQTNQEKFLSVDITSLDNSKYSVYANTLPSLWQVSGIQTFIVKNDKYPSNPVITVLAADDEIGSIIIMVQYNNLSNNTESKFAIKYTGITNYTNSKVNFQGSALKTQPTTTSGNLVYPDQTVYDITSVNGFSEYDKKLASQITATELANLYSTSLISYMGFTPTATIVQSKDSGAASGNSSLDQEYGSILLKLDFTNSESSVLTNSKGEKVKFPKTFYGQMGLKDGVVYVRYGGLLPIGSTYNISLNTTGSNYKSLIADNNVNASINSNQLLGILTINGYENGEVTIQNYYWSGENLVFQIHAQSKTYESISDTQSFNVSWSPKFASIRNMSLSVAVITSIVGITLVSLAVSMYIIRRNKIRKLLK